MFKKKKKVALRVPFTPTTIQAVTSDSHSIHSMKKENQKIALILADK